MEAVNNRSDYVKAFGLKYDPFISPVAEHELNEVQTLDKFLSYFTLPKVKAAGQPVEWLNLQDLREKNNRIIFGQPGAGKTTLRLALETEYRRTFSNRLVVTLELQHPGDNTSPPKDIYEQLAEAIAIDLFFQVCEQYNPMTDHPFQEQLDALAEQIHFARMERTIEIILDEANDQMPFGVAAHWSRGRRAIRYVPPTHGLLEMLQHLLARSGDAPVLSGEPALERCLAACRLWKFNEIAVLVDTVDQFSPDTHFMFQLIKPLLSQADYWKQNNIFLKMFLMENLQPVIDRFLNENLLYDNFVSATIIWDEENLSQLVQNRFEAAGSRHTSLGAFASDDAANQLDQYLFSNATTPREVLKRINFFLQEIPRGKQTASVDFAAADVHTIEDLLSRSER